MQDLVISTILLLLGMPMGDEKIELWGACVAVMGLLLVGHTCVWGALDHLDPTFKNRTLASWSESECWEHLRLHKDDIYLLMNRLNFPAVLEFGEGRAKTSLSGEYAFCIMLHRLH